MMLADLQSISSSMYAHSSHERGHRTPSSIPGLLISVNVTQTRVTCDQWCLTDESSPSNGPMEDFSG